MGLVSVNVLDVDEILLRGSLGSLDLFCIL